MPASADCLTTTVKNISSKREFFSFLGQHGKWLDAGASFTFIGSPESMVQVYSRSHSARRLAAYVKALVNQTLRVEATPSPHLRNAAGTISKTVRLTTPGTGIEVIDTCQLP